VKNSQEINSPQKPLTFPEGFLWGAATSHFQVEGNPDEISNRLSDWSRWTEDPAHITDHTSADHACEFYQRFSSDLDLMVQLNLNAFRLSLNWAAICPAPGAINMAMIDYYRQLLQETKKRNIKTFVTLFHFCLPNWLAEKGGWLSDETVIEFGKFAELACRQLGNLVDFWQTINEPMSYVYHGFIVGTWPPGLKNKYLEAFKAIRGFLAGHALAYRAIRSIDAKVQISYAMHWQPFIGRNKSNPFDFFVARCRNIVFNHIFPNAIQSGSLAIPFPFNLYKELRELAGPIAHLKDSADYLAINYYTRDICEFSWNAPSLFFGVRSEVHRPVVNALGWEVFPSEMLDQYI